MTENERWQDKQNADNRPYLKYTGPQRLESALQTLAGLLTGIAADGEITVEEARGIQAWLDENSEFKNRNPFDEVAKLFDAALEDGELDTEEVQDILWMCEKFQPKNKFFNRVTADIQKLHGILGGISIDGVITVDELSELDAWIIEHDNLKGFWPFDELDSLITDVLADGKIDSNEHRRLMSYFSDFADHGSHALEMPLNDTDGELSGVCAMQPEIVFDGRVFCFTGGSERATRRQLEVKITGLGAEFSKRVTHSIDYLIIGAKGNVAWCYSCYGRKVEQAVTLRKQGHQILLVHENDFWDAVEDM